MICAPKNRRFFGGSKSLVEYLSVCISSNLSINYIRCCAMLFFSELQLTQTLKDLTQFPQIYYLYKYP